jgi:hypothetical protein
MLIGLVNKSVFWDGKSRIFKIREMSKFKEKKEEKCHRLSRKYWLD